MRVELAGRMALICGSAGPLAAAVAESLAANGARVSRVAATHVPAGPDLWDEAFLLVNVSRGAESLPDRDAPQIAATELADFSQAARSLGQAARDLAPGAKRVVNVISAAGLVPLRGAASFCAEQAGLATLTRALAMELAPQLVVNGAAVGAFSLEAGEPQAARLLSHSALQRPATAAEIMAAVLFLADPANTYMTGHTLVVDGGWAAGYARNF